MGIPLVITPKINDHKTDLVKTTGELSPEDDQSILIETLSR